MSKTGKETLVFGSIYTNVTLSSVPSLNAVTGCVWLRSLAGATIVSYAVSDNDNELMIAANREKMSLGIRDEFEKRRVDLSDTVWRHLCVTWSSLGGVWKMYLNGASFTSGTDLESGKTVAGGGLLVLGQDQDSLGGGYDAHQALIGSLTEFNMWSRVLSDDEILAVANDCSIGGDVFTWYNVSLHIEGDVSLATSDICHLWKAESESGSTGPVETTFLSGGTCNGRPMVGSRLVEPRRRWGWWRDSLADSLMA
ncbi:neuronal pentraxin receptor-like [Ptychodera flava]|uniref:neuronal pentraxin receptor-like n=1 Tax=Ptychodera flava TaxID=63121 RepID=UPI00396A68C0